MAALARGFSDRHFEREEGPGDEVGLIPEPYDPTAERTDRRHWEQEWVRHTCIWTMLNDVEYVSPRKLGFIY